MMTYVYWGRISLRFVGCLVICFFFIKGQELRAQQTHLDDSDYYPAEILAEDLNLTIAEIQQSRTNKISMWEEDDPNAYTFDKTRLETVFDQLLPTTNDATSAGARSIFFAIGERFQRNRWHESLYDARGAWCTEFVTFAYLSAGMKIKHRDRVNNSRRFGYCIANSDPNDAELILNGEEANPQLGDAIFFYWGATTSESYRYYNGRDCFDTYDANTMDGLYCSGHSGLVIGIDGDDLITVEGNVGGRVRIMRRSNYKTNPKIVGYGRINADHNELDCTWTWYR